MNDILLEIEHVSKHFGETQALKDISLTIRKGKIHSLLGRNGAGKSTLVNIIAGIYRQNEGRVLLEGKEISQYSVSERQERGIRIVPQHASIIPDVTVAENVFMGIWPKKKTGMVDWKRLYKEAAVELEKYGLDVDLKAKVKTLNGVDKRKVNIVRAMHGGAKLIILDEPTTALSSVERQELFRFVDGLKKQGTAFIFISHYLQEVVELSDDVTVIRDGMAFPGSDGGKEFSEHQLSVLIVGENVQLVTRTKLQLEKKEPALDCRHLTGEILKDVSVKLYKKEIVGVVGFPGSGAREFCRTLSGLAKLQSGEIIHPRLGSIRVANPSSAMRQGITYLSFDRHKEAIIKLMSICENINLPLLGTVLKKKTGMIDKKKSIANAKHFFDLLSIKANSVFEEMNRLSGGNQQKVVVGKVLGTKPDVLLLDEPTIGIDIKSREQIIETIDNLTKNTDTSVVYLTNDFDELLRITDRILFFSDGKMFEDVANDNLTHEDVIRIRDSVKVTSHTAAAKNQMMGDLDQ
jgi:ABC-type sugar transport system ATPase subunit